MVKWEYQNKLGYLENSVAREPCKQRTACNQFLLLIFLLFQFKIVVNVDEIVIYLLLVHEHKTVEKPVFIALIIVVDIIIALMIERKIKFSAINPKEYYCKPSVLHILIITANLIFSIAVFVPQVFSDSVLIDAIFITIWYYCIDVYVFTYIYFNVPKRKYAIRYIKKIFCPPKFRMLPTHQDSQ